MPNLMQRGATWLGSRLQTAAGRSVTYRRGNGTPVVLTSPAIVPTLQLATDTEGGPTQLERRDWLVTVADLGFEPLPGDFLTEVVGAVTTDWLVLEPPQTKCFEDYGDPGVLWRVHTQKYEVEE